MLTVDLDVVKFVPSSIGGYAFLDGDNDGDRETGELGLENVTVLLIGTDFRGTPVSMETSTDSSGHYSFLDVAPGDYHLQQVQPANLRDGQDTPDSGGTLTSNDRVAFSIPIEGGLDSTNNLFGELGLNAPFLSVVPDLLARGYQASGLLFSIDGNNAWAAFIGDGWANYSDARIAMSADGQSATVTVNHNGSERSLQVAVGLPEADMRVREFGTQRVIRIIAEPEEFQLAAAAEGEAGDQAAYAEAVDQVMATAVA